MIKIPSFLEFPATLFTLLLVLSFSCDRNNSEGQSKSTNSQAVSEKGAQEISGIQNNTNEGRAHTGQANGNEQDLLTAEKPRIDDRIVLEELDLYRAKRYESIHTAIASGPDSIYKLVLYGKKLGVLDPQLGRLSMLHSLDVAYNELEDLPPELSSLHYLHGFYANGNKLNRFPKQIILLPLLSKLDLSENLISEIPAEIRRMDQLVKLDLGENNISDLPMELYGLTRLEVLTLDHNSLSGISSEIKNLQSLRKLDLSNNHLRTLPKEIISLGASLTDLEIQGNEIPLEEIMSLKEAMPNTNIRY
jgi:Leucine-rich repeat (LRR) protein